MSSVLHEFCQTDSFCYCLCGRLFPYTSVPSRRSLNKTLVCQLLVSDEAQPVLWKPTVILFFKLYSFVTLYHAITLCQFCHMISSSPQNYLSALQMLFGSSKLKHFELNGCNSWMDKHNVFSPSKTSQIKTLNHSPINFHCKMIKSA